MRTRTEYLIFGSPRIEQDEIDEVVSCLKSGWISTGPRVAKFEEDFQNYTGARFAIALNSCTAGLHLALHVAGIRSGDEVITSPITFGATANAVIAQGAIPVFVDVQTETMNINPELIEREITPRTRAIIPVHLAGRPCEMDEIMRIARKYNLIVIEDAAHALEAWYKNQKVGTIGDITAFSFYATKNLTTGEGGMVTTQNEKWADDLNILRLHGLSKGAWRRYSDESPGHYQVLTPGFKYNMMDIQAAMGIKQLEKIEKYLVRRNEIWQKYDEAFRDLPVMTPAPVSEYMTHARHLYTLLIDIDKLNCTRDKFKQTLHEMNIGSGIHFISLHMHPYYKNQFGYEWGDFPEAEFISDRTISLPLSAKLTDEDVQDVIEAVKYTIDKYYQPEFINIGMELNSAFA